MPNKILNTTCARCVDHITNSQLRNFQNVQIKLKLVILKHIIKGIVKLIRDFLDLELLTVDLILNVINPEVQFGDVHLSVFIASLSNLETFHKCVDFVFELLFPLLSFLGRNLELFHVLTNSFQFLVNSSSFCSLSDTILVVSLTFLSASSISTSLFMVLFSKNLTCFRIASASLEARASLVTVSAKLPSAFLASSSISMIRRLKALTSSSAFLKFFSASSRVVRALFNLSFVSSKSTS